MKEKVGFLTSRIWGRRILQNCRKFIPIFPLSMTVATAESPCFEVEAETTVERVRDPAEIVECLQRI